ncbi:MAG: hypothetical protein ACM3KD_06800 [Hyphomicrobiaceae bacterium]
MKIMTSTIVASVLLAAASLANAAPVALSDAQMDGVTAGATAIAAAGAGAFGDLISATGAYTNTVAVAPGFARAGALSTAIAASVYWGAAAQSAAHATASLP